MIALKVAIDICRIVDNPTLPLDTLDDNIV